MRRGLVRSPVPWRVKDLTMPYAEAKPPFRTYEQIARKIVRGGTEQEEADQWDRLYLNGDQVEGVLNLVAERPTEPFVYPMFCFVALTGARRSERGLTRYIET